MGKKTPALVRYPNAMQNGFGFGRTSPIRVEGALPPPYLRDFADRCRRMARWERNPMFKTMLLRKAEDYDRQAGTARLA